MTRDDGDKACEDKPKTLGYRGAQIRSNPKWKCEPVEAPKPTSWCQTLCNSSAFALAVDSRYLVMLPFSDIYLVKCEGKPRQP